MSFRVAVLALPRRLVFVVFVTAGLFCPSSPGADEQNVGVTKGVVVSAEQDPALRSTKARTSEEKASVSGTVEELARKVEPWIVAIEVKRSRDLKSFVPIRSRFLPQEAKDYFKRPEGYVTGLLVNRRGDILTSYYNIGGELESIQVILADGTKRRAAVVAIDKLDDLALLRLEGDLPVLSKADWQEPPWANADPGAGRIVFALGRSPHAEELTVTQGIISAAGRNGGRTFQTDTKLNYGNVGGPLVGLDGRIVGISCFVGHTYPQWGLNSGIGFGTTAKTVRDALLQLERGQDVEPPEIPFLGVQSRPEVFNAPGAKIAEVYENTAASKAGLRKSDIIVELAGEHIINFHHLRRVLFGFKVGDVVEIKVRRGDNLLTLRTTLGKRPF